ncbi:SusC/RagA family TonB-linked outer membrane protein [Chitinophaga lutea]
MQRTSLWLLLAALLWGMDAAAQHRISGRVLSTQRTPIPGATVQIKSSKIAAATAEDGSFSLQSPTPTAILVISSIGFERKEVSATAGAAVTIELRDDAKSLSDVVVVGYGAIRKTDLTGSVASLKSAQLQEFPAVSIEQAVQGRMAGVQVQQTSGQPGAGISMRIRGVSSIAGGNEPLYVVDGLPQFNDDVRGANGLSSINPSDIESIEVLKDAAATAIYGSRGANGVVMITTKIGKAGRDPRVTFESSLGLQTVRKKLDMMGTDEYVAFAKSYFTNSNINMPAELTNFSKTADTDWQDEVFRTALISNSSLSMSGATDKSRYYVSAGYTSQQGIVENSGYKRVSLRANLDNTLNRWLTMQTRMMAARSVQNGFAPAVGDNTRNFGKSGIGSVLRSISTVPVRKADGTYTDTSPFSFNGIDVENPVAMALEVLDRNTTTRFQGALDFKATLAKGLENITRVAADYYHIRRDLYFPRILPQLGGGIGNAELGNYDKTSVLAEDYLQYRYNFDPTTYIEAIAGISYQKDRLNTTDIAASGFGSDDLKNYNFSSANSVSKPVTDVIESTLISAFGRVRFNLKDKYLFAVSLRRDGASVFAENNKYGTFPSVSAGWRMSEEEFMKGIEWLSNVKIRASWGEAGNPAIKPYQSLLLGRTVNTGQGAGTGLVVGIAPTLPNPDLKWETTAQTDVGIDLGFVNERFRLTFDYYIKNTKDLLALVQLPPSAGVSAGIGTGPDQIIDNVGEVQNKGWELTVGANILNSRDWGLTVDVNLSGNKNKVTKTKNGLDVPTMSGGNDASGSNSIIRQGEPLSAFFGPVFLGLDKDGVPIHENVNGDKDQNGRDIINALDNQIIGSPYPDLYYGINPTLRYKRLTLSSVWAGVSGLTINNGGLFELTGPNVQNSYNKLKVAAEMYPRPSQLAGNYHLRSSRFMEDGSFFRLRNVRLDYAFAFRNTSAVKALNVYISGQNLLTWTDYSGFDPEVNSFNGNDRRQGVDLAAYPAARTYTLGFNVTF